MDDEQTKGRSASFLLPAACVVCGVLGALHIMAVGFGISAILVQVGNFGIDLSFLGPFQYRAPGMSEGMIQVLLMLLWGGICALPAWYVRARFWSAILAAAALLCPLSLNARLGHVVIGVLTAALIAGMVGTGISAARNMSDDRRKADVAGAIFVAVVLLVAFSLGVLWFCSYGAGGGTNFSVFFMMWLILVFPPFLLAAVTLGYYLPRIRSGVRTLPRTQSYLIPLLPIIAIVPAAMGMNLHLKREIHFFSCRSFPRFVSYVDAKFAPFFYPGKMECYFADPDTMEVSFDWERPDGIRRAFDGKLPIRWTERTGIKPPVDFRWIEYNVVTDLKGRPLGNKLYCDLLPDRAALYRFLDRINARPEIRHANWKLAPVTGKVDTPHHYWEAICRIDGADLTVFATADWRLLIKPAPQHADQ